MARKKTIVLIPIMETRCSTCTLLERTVYEDSNGRIVEGYKCPLNRVLPPLIEPYFAEKCSFHKPKGGLRRGRVGVGRLTWRSPKGLAGRSHPAYHGLFPNRGWKVSAYHGGFRNERGVEPLKAPTQLQTRP